MLRLSEDRDAVLPERELREQELVQTVEKLLARSAGRDVHAELVEQCVEHLHAVQKRVEDERRLGLLAIELVDQVATECGLPRAGLTGDEHEPFTIVDAVQELAFRL